MAEVKEKAPLIAVSEAGQNQNGKGTNNPAGLVSIAENLITAGISILPVKVDKKPVLEWKHLQEQAMGDNEINFQFRGAWGVGAICGKVSEGLECIDFDNKVPHIGDIWNEYIQHPDVKRIIEQGRLYAQKTLRGGFHLVYRYESDIYEGSVELAFEPNPNAGDDVKIIETRGEGSYFVISPSPGYTPLFGDPENIGTLSKEQRDYLISYAKRFDKSTNNKNEHKALRTARKMIQNAKDGSKHKELRDAARLVGGYIAAGEIKEDDAIEILEYEIKERDIEDEAAAEKTIRTGIEYGKLDPLYSDQYLRVGSDYFKVINKTDRFGIDRIELKKWQRQTLIDDHGTKYLKQIKKFDDFIIRPSNTNYTPTVNNCYNLYREFQHKPEPGQWYWTGVLLRHVFGDQYELGLRYMKLLYMHPDRIAPILVLVSKERQTGKTTFLNWLAMVYGANMVIIGAQDLTNDFNHLYATSNIIAIEETLIEKSLTVEKLKALATNKFVSVNQKHVAQFKTEFFGKFILTSNNEDKFAKVDQDEVRFFVRKLGTPQEENHDIETNLSDEIPAFLHHLTTLPPIDFKVSRTGFTAAELENDSLKKVKEESRSGLYHELREQFTDLFQDKPTTTELHASPIDIKDKWFRNNSNISAHYIKKVLRDEFEMNPSNKVMRYEPLCIHDGVTKTGTPYTFEREIFLPF